MKTDAIQFDQDDTPTTPYERIAHLAEELGPEGVANAVNEVQKRMISPEEVAESDAVMARADLIRQRAAEDLSAMVWTSATGERIPLKLTSSRYGNYEWLRRMRRGDEAGEEVTINEAMASRFLDAGLLLFLCATPPLPYGSTPESALRASEEWMDEHIQIGRQQTSLSFANAILDLTDLFVPVARQAEADDEVEAQKKRPVQDGKPVT